MVPILDGAREQADTAIQLGRRCPTEQGQTAERIPHRSLSSLCVVILLTATFVILLEQSRV